MGIKNAIASMVADGVDGSVSSKRVITFIAMALVATAFLGNLFFHLKMDDYIYNPVVYIAISGMGFVGLEKFAPKTPNAE